ncbi:MAG: hypothetical protein ACXVLQ_09610 [Bacteriovorax sp.]
MKRLALISIFTLLSIQESFAMGSSILNCTSSDGKIVLIDENGYSTIEIAGNKTEASIENYSLDQAAANKVTWSFSENKILKNEEISNNCEIHHEKVEFQNMMNLSRNGKQVLSKLMTCKEELITSSSSEDLDSASDCDL